jgi:hypothetical protein
MREFSTTKQIWMWLLVLCSEKVAATGHHQGTRTFRKPPALSREIGGVRRERRAENTLPCKILRG